jgi:hypothetical protein
VEEKQCPCESVRELQAEIKKHRTELAKGDIRFAVIDTKLNLIIAIMAFLGAAVGGVVVSMLFV